MRTTRQIIADLKAAGLNQARISCLTGIPQPRLSRWENGSVPAGADDALKLASLLAQQLGTEGAPDLPAEEVRDAA